MLEIIKGTSHLDHGLTGAHVEWLLSLFKDKNAFFIETVVLPDNELAPLECGLYGPTMGDEPIDEGEVFYELRGSGRKWTTRFIKKPMRPTRKLTVIAGPHEDKPCILYTAYGGPAAPREPGDTTLQSWEQVLEARAFWKVHALSAAANMRPWVSSEAHVNAFMERARAFFAEVHCGSDDDKSSRDFAFGGRRALEVVEHELLHGVHEKTPGKVGR